MKILFLLPALIACLGLIPDQVTAQTFTTLHNFTALTGPDYSTNADGARPRAGLISSGNTLYGTARTGGSSGGGTVLALNADGTGFTNLYTFDGGSDGAGPNAMILLSGALYGTAGGGGSSGNGTVFRLNTDGTEFTNLHSFTRSTDGADPQAGLITNSSGNTLYGTAELGGSSNNGTVFRLNTDGTGFTNLHSFTALNNDTNSDGANPRAGLILSGDALYGTSFAGGGSVQGTVFKVNIDGTGFTNLHSFGNVPFDPPYINSDGADPYAELLLSGNTLYGTAVYGGSSGNGTVFSLSFTPQLIIIPSGANVILTWPANYAGFDYTGYTLQSAPAITGIFTNIPGATNPYTNPITGGQEFYRLRQ